MSCAIDQEAPPLVVDPLLETHLMLAVAAESRFARRASVTPEDIAAVPWIASPARPREPLFGACPGPRTSRRSWRHPLPEKPAGSYVPTAGERADLVGRAGLRVADAAQMGDADAESSDWTRPSAT